MQAGEDVYSDTVTRNKKHGHWAAHFYDEVYRVNIELIWPVNNAQVKRYVESEHKTEYTEEGEFGAKCIRIQRSDGAYVNIICLTSWPAKPDATDHSFLTHEAFHATTHILARAGMPLEIFVSSEAYAFLLESIVRRSLILLDTKRRIAP